LLKQMTEASVIRIKPYFYIHVLDNNTNVTRVETGPQTFTRRDHEKVTGGPEAMVMIPPRHYVTVANPVVRDEKTKNIQYTETGQIKLKHGDEEVRFDPEPFPLFPGEKLVGKVAPLTVVAPNTAIRLRCIRDFTDKETKQTHHAGDEWLFEGPGTYYPRVEVQVVESVKAQIIKPLQALKLRARKGTVDRQGIERRAGEEWLMKQPGAYLAGVDEEVVEVLNAFVLTEKKAIHLRATRTFVDAFKKERKAGEEWLVTNAMGETHIPDVYEQVVSGDIKLTTLTSRQYCVVLDPYIDGKNRLGQRELRKGERSFFLNPGERLENGIQNVVVLGSEEALLLKAREAWTDDEKKTHAAGDRWMLYGPADFVPPVQVEVIEKRQSIPLGENEGIYVRDIKTGKVRAVTAESYMLKPNEEMWKKELPQVVEDLLAKQADNENPDKERDKTRVVTYRAPHNSAVQIYDYKEKKSRVVFGPEMVMLGPDEQFTVLSLSGDKPKRPHVIKSLCLLLGPDFMTDIVIVETADHARLSLKLSYNWMFDLDKTKAADAAKIFQVPDFVGDACKAIASRIRGAVAAVSFDAFHRSSARIIRTAVFGVDDKEKVRKEFRFSQNDLVFTNIDIQSVEPVDQRTRDSLQKSVQLAIEITTKSQEAQARQDSARMEQEAMGILERQKIHDEAAAEKAKRDLLQLQADSAAIESAGQATAEAKARAKASQIEGEAAVEMAELNASAQKIKSETELAIKKAKQLAEIEHKKRLNSLEINKARNLADIESAKFKEVVSSIGANTIKSMAEAGPQMQAKLLQGLGLKSFLITDGNSPINLFNTASGLVGGQGVNQQ